MSLRSKQQVVTEFRCAEILTAARKTFSKKGFEKVTVDEIAEAAGLSKATVYQYFSSKQEIYLAALSEGVKEMAERTQRQVQAAVEVRAKVEAFIRTRLEFLYENRDFFAVYHAEFGNLIHPASLNQEFRNLFRLQFQTLQSVLEGALQQGELADVSTETLATVIYESTRGLMLRRSLGWTTATVDEQVASLMKILWAGVGQRASTRAHGKLAAYVDR
jgi:AcrR family transcriptional regulator